jgi:hypothetical protein
MFVIDVVVGGGGHPLDPDIKGFLLVVLPEVDAALSATDIGCERGLGGSVRSDVQRHEGYASC